MNNENSWIPLAMLIATIMAMFVTLSCAVLQPYIQHRLNNPKANPDNSQPPDRATRVMQWISNQASTVAVLSLIFALASFILLVWFTEVVTKLFVVGLAINVGAVVFSAIMIFLYEIKRQVDFLATYFRRLVSIQEQTVERLDNLTNAAIPSEAEEPSTLFRLVQSLRKLMSGQE